MDFIFPTTGKYTIYCKRGCVFCDKAKNMLRDKELDFVQIDCDEYLLNNRDGFLMFIELIANKPHRTFPIIFDASGNFVGGASELNICLEKHLVFGEEKTSTLLL